MNLKTTKYLKFEYMTIFQCYYLSPVDNHFDLLLKDFFLQFHVTNVNKFQQENIANT